MGEFDHWDEDDWRDFYEERAAILEFDAGHPRRVAERLAIAEVRSLRKLPKWLPSGLKKSQRTFC